MKFIGNGHLMHYDGHDNTQTISFVIPFSMCQITLDNTCHKLNQGHDLSDWLNPVLIISWIMLYMVIYGFKLHTRFTGNGKLVHYDRCGNLW